MDNPLITRIVAAYGLTAYSVLPAQKGYRNASHAVTLADGRIVNLILFKREADIVPRIRRMNRVSDYAASRGLPTRQSLSPRIIQLKAEEFEQYGALYSYLPGFTMPWEAYTKDHIKLLGMAMSYLHHALRELPNGNALPSAVDEYSGQVDHMATYFGAAAVTKALADKLGLTVPMGTVRRYKLVLRLCQELPNQQALHMDFVRGNILFDNDAAAAWSLLGIDNLVLTGILDFEKTAYGSPLLDIARTLAFLLVDCKGKPEAKVRKYFLLSGYNKRGSTPYQPVAITHRAGRYDILEELINLFLLYDLYKFLRHNPYEFLSKNEHYVRTRDILLARGIITAVNGILVTNRKI